jgi:hypothetical protein
MSSAGGILERIKDIDFKRSLAHVFPGFLLYIGLIMASDAFLSHDQVLTESFFDPTTNIDLLVSLILIGLFVGSILGIMIDGIAHWAFEERWFNKIVKTHKLSGSDGSLIMFVGMSNKIGYVTGFHYTLVMT